MTTVKYVLIHDTLENHKKYKEEKKKEKEINKMKVKIEKYCEKSKVSQLRKVPKQRKTVSKGINTRKRKIKTKTRSQLVKELDAIFSRYIRLRDADDKGICTCITCGDKKPRREMHNTHFISRSNYKYRRSVVNCWAGCYKCNVILNGNYIAYTLVMIKKYGEGMIREMQKDKELVKISIPDIREMIEKYNYEVELLMKVKSL